MPFQEVGINDMEKVGYKFSASLTFLLSLVIFITSYRDVVEEKGVFYTLGLFEFPGLTHTLSGIFVMTPLILYSVYQIINSLIKNYKKFRNMFYLELSLICVLSLFTLLTIFVILAPNKPYNSIGTAI